VGETVLDSTDISPRLAASYDVRGDGSLLVSASAGRYIAHMAQGWSTNFTDEPAGRIHFDEYMWTGSGYDLPVGRISGTESPQHVDPAYKDEFTVGTDWQFHPDWAFRARAVYWERRNFSDILDQVGADGQLVREVANTPGAVAVRRALNLSVQRRYTDSWSLLAAYTWSRTEGNCPWDEFLGCAAELGELSHFTGPDGVPLSRVNRWGPLPEDREHNLKLSGSYRLGLGKGHSLDFSAYTFFQSGKPWQQTMRERVEGYPWRVIKFTEPRGARRNPDQHQLNLSVGWSFPLSGRFSGQLLFDVINATDEQGLIGTIGRDTDPDNEPYPTSINYQLPRWYRFMATLRF
jgi:outer membrane receptor protein involved in Fe transport